MKVRLTGKEVEVESMICILKGVSRVQILEESDFYPNRGNSKLGRVYLELEVRP